MRKTLQEPVPRVALLVVLIIALIAYASIREWRRHRTGNAEQPAPVASRMGPMDIYPDAARSPGAINPDITQDNIQDTICNPRWSTRSVRPPQSYTHDLKVQQIREYGLADTDLRDYEEDHLIPLEIGGAPSDPRNLWPEAYQTSVPDGGARFKDKVENYLHDEVCVGHLTLAQAQSEIAGDWYRVYQTSVAQ